MITSIQDQWLGDIVIRESGCIEAIVEVAIENEISVTDKMIPGLQVLQPIQANRHIVNYYNTNNIYPATAADLEVKSFRGIGYMAVGVNFIVS